MAKVVWIACRNIKLHTGSANAGKFFPRILAAAFRRIFCSINFIAIRHQPVLDDVHSDAKTCNSSDVQVVQVIVTGEVMQTAHAVDCRDTSTLGQSHYRLHSTY